jgi:membrane protein
MISPGRGFIASDSGIVLKTENGGKDWQIIETNDTSVSYLSIAFNQNTGIITGTKGKILYSRDYGTTWEERTINEAKRKKKIPDLNTVFFTDRNEVWIAGNDGLILKSNDRGESWTQSNFKEYNFYTMVFLSSNEGYIAGENGIIIRTINGGETWRSEKIPTYRVSKMLLSEKNVWAVGNGGTIQSTMAGSNKWSGKSGKSIVNMAVSFFAPFLFIWLLFVLAYTAIPNTRVPFRFSSIGAAFTGTVWVIFILLFIYYIKAFAKGTFAIYGALAAFPLFLLMVYASALIILYGAEVSYTLMHPESYKSLKNTFQGIKKVNLFYGLAILHHIYSKFESGNGSSSYTEIMKKIKFNAADLDYFIKLFSDSGYISNDSKGYFLPTCPSANIKLMDVFDTIHESEMHLPPSVKKNNAKANIKEIFDRLTDARHKVLGEMTLKDLKM